MCRFVWSGSTNHRRGTKLDTAAGGEDAAAAAAGILALSIERAPPPGNVSQVGAWFNRQIIYSNMQQPGSCQARPLRRPMQLAVPSSGSRSAGRPPLLLPGNTPEVARRRAPFSNHQRLHSLRLFPHLGIFRVLST